MRYNFNIETRSWAATLLNHLSDDALREVREACAALLKIRRHPRRLVRPTKKPRRKGKR